MPKRKKHPKLPNGYGSIKYLGKNRRNPYGVYPPVTAFTEDGVAITPKALCYVRTWTVGFAVLTAYHAGTYEKGMESLLPDDADQASGDTLIQNILANYNRISGQTTKSVTFSEVYAMYYTDKFEQSQKPYSKSSMAAMQTAYKKCEILFDRPFRDIRYEDLQKILDDCKLKKASIQMIVLLLKQMWQYGELHELCDKNYAAYIKIRKEDDEQHGVPFSDDDLNVLWSHKDNPTVELLLIMCYSGFRISEYITMEVNLDEMYFKGGVKTAASKNRIVPIHSAIQDLVKERMRRDGGMLRIRPAAFRKNMDKVLKQIGIERHTPHDCRHTFSALCEKYRVSENDRKRMLGHAFQNDVTNSVYGHRTLEDLREEIEKIQICC